MLQRFSRSSLRLATLPLLLAAGLTACSGGGPPGAETMRRVEVSDSAVATGKALFATCAACHGPDALGDVGPNIRGRTDADIQIQLDNNQAMQFMILSSNEIDALAAYLTWMATLD